MAEPARSMSVMARFHPDRRKFLVMAVGLCLLGNPSAAFSQAKPIRIVALGDSLTAGYGLAPGAAFPDQLQIALRERGHNLVIENAGVSGDTASGGRDRVDWSVPDGTDLVIVELGANDSLRGIDPAVTKQALDELVTRLKQRRISVMLAGMLAPPNNGEAYARAFNGIFPALAERHGTVLYPFFLDGVAGNPRLNLPDGIHPTREGVAEIVRRIVPSVEEALKRLPKAG